MSTDSKRIQPILSLVISLVLVLAMIALALPTPVQAKTPCVATHVVKKGETTVTISKTYGIKWREIAAANKLDDDYELEVGDSLCIPPKDYVAPSSTKIAARSSGGRLTIVVSGLSEKSAFYVRVRDGSKSVGGFIKLGGLKVKKNTTATAVFSVPKELRTKLYLQVCLKNATTDELVCQSIINQ